MAAGVARSRARELIRQGRVSVAGAAERSCDLKVDEGAEIAVDGKPASIRKHRYIMMNKPAGWLSATEDPRERTVLDLLPPEYRRLGLFCAGRLDRDSEGLLLLTNDGDFCHRVISPKKRVWKEYFVELERPFPPGAEALFASGLALGDGTVCLPARLETLPGGLSALVWVAEGRYHQVKRMALAAGSGVKYLRRLAIGGLRLDGSLLRAASASSARRK
jgi:16S rRNA pseudouridine516 synthase